MNVMISFNEKEFVSSNLSAGIVKRTTCYTILNCNIAIRILYIVMNIFVSNHDFLHLFKIEFLQILS